VTAYDAQDRCVGVDVELEALLKHLLVAFLAPKRTLAVAARQVVIRQRIPQLDIDSVHDAEKRIAAGDEQAVQAAAMRFGLDLARVAGADRADGIGVIKPGFHEGQLSVKLEPLHGKAFRRKLEVGHRGTVEIALEGEVVHGHERSGARSGNEM
jgi:hypothetical protein